MEKIEKDTSEFDAWYAHTKNIDNVKSLVYSISSIEESIKYWENVMDEEFVKLSNNKNRFREDCNDYNMLMIDMIDFEVRAKFEDAIKYKIHVLEERKKQYKEKLNELVK